MPITLEDLLRVRATRALAVDDEGRVLVQDNETGTPQLYEVAPDGTWTALTDLGEACSGRYLAGERVVVVSHDSGGNERRQLSLLRLDRYDGPGGPPGPAGPDDLEPLVHDERYVHLVLDVLPGRVVYSTNRRDGVEFDVIVRDVATGEERVLYDGGGWASEAVVSPDEKWVVVGRPGGPARSVQALLVETASGTVTELSAWDEPAEYRDFCWLPDSSGFLFTTDSGREYSGVARYAVDARTWTYVVTDDEHDLAGRLDPAGTSLLVTTFDDCAQTAALHDPRTGERVTGLDLPAGGIVSNPFMPAPAWSPSGSRLALTFTSPVEPGDVWTWDGTALTRVTDSAAELDRTRLVQPESYRVPTPDGERVPCFVYRGADADGSVVVSVHGGPEASAYRTWNPITQALVLAGHTVLVPNVRGSVGYGKRWAALDDVRRRLDSVADLAALHDWLPELGLDPKRAALHGGSYGGYMTLAGLTMQPERWAAGADIVGMSSLVTFLENTSPYRRSQREREYGSLERDREFLVAASPLTHIDAIRAPLFVIHGANDPRVPLGEAEQVVAAVCAAGAEGELLVYRDEGHGLAKRVNQLDAYPRMLAFLARHLAVPAG